MSNKTFLTPNSQANDRRKKEQLHIALSNDVAFKGVPTGLDNYYFVHQALPEIDLSSVDMSTNLFGKVLSAPLVISSMVGGIEQAAHINRNLAQAAQIMGLAIGVGSQRCFIDAPETAPTYQIRDVAPDILLFANLGAVQLNYGYDIIECQRIIEVIGADALILHLNPLHEALQPEGNTNFASLLSKIRKVCAGLSVPVLVKEVGYGISRDVAAKLAEVGVAGIDVAGAGGTSFGEIERYRARDVTANNIVADFASWGIPTTKAIIMAREGAPQLTLIASGGLRTGIDVAKVIALGADAAAIGMPLLKAANISAEDVITALKQILEELRISMFCIGSTRLEEVKNSPFLEGKSND